MSARPPQEPAIDDRSFDPRAQVLTVRYVRVLAYCVLLGCLVWWPVDHWLYRDQPAMRDALTALRAPLVALAVLGLSILHAMGEAHRLIKPVLAVAMTTLVAVLAHAIAGLDARFFMAGICLPLATIPLTVPRRERIFFTVGVAITYFAGYVSGDPEVAADTLGNAIGLLGFCSVVSVVFGHVFYETLRENHAQQVLLDERARKLEELDAIKNDFFANVSHELRTPLTLVLGHLGGLARDLGAPEVPRAAALGKIEVAERNAARLLLLIEELLELARLQGGRALPMKRAVDLTRLVTDVASNFHPSEAEQRAVSLELPDELSLEADPRQLRTALHNLISNAMKFSDPEHRRVVVRALAEPAGVRIEVEDDGIGIAAGELERIFDRFYRVERGPARLRGGTGIGLSLVKEIAEAHGGRIEVKSEPGRGSTFAMVLPRGAPEDTGRPATQDGPPEPLRRLAIRTSLPAALAAPDAAPGASPRTTVVVAEDDPDLRHYVTSVLAREHRVIAVADGAEAIAAVKERRPDALVTDVMMPGKSGLDAARALRSDPDHARLPILFLTAKVGAEARAESYGVGADDFLAKPFDEAELLARLGNLLRLHASERALADSNDVLSREVAARTAELRRLAEHLEEAREDERRHLAREIHDETGQLLTALRMELDLALELTTDGELRESLERMTTVLEQTLAATRTLVAELRPRVLDDLGLGAAVEWLVSRFGIRSRLLFDYRIEPPDLVAGPAVSTATYRVLQESLTNVARHSQASRIDVCLTRRGETIVLEVADDGVGVDGSARSEGTGVIGMRERAQALGGTFSLSRRDEGGTLMRLSLRDAVHPEQALPDRASEEEAT